MRLAATIFAAFSLAAFGQSYQIARTTGGQIDVYDKLPTGLVSACSMWITGAGTNGVTLYDYSANANHGALTNGAYAALRSGRDKGTLCMDGINDHVVLPNAATLRPGGAFTFSAWVQTTNYTRTVWQSYNYSPDKGVIVSRRAAASAGALQTQVNNGTAHVLNGTDSLNEAYPWRHVVLTHSGSTDIQYIDGVPTATNTSSADATYNAANYVLLGATRYDTGSFYGGYWDGQISRAYLFNRALSAAEVAALYNQQFGDYYPTLQWRVRTADFPWDAVKYGNLVYVSASGGGTNGATSYVEAYSDESGVQQASVALGNANINGLIISGATIYAPCVASNAVAEINAETCAVSAWITGTPSAYSAAVQDTNLWVGCTNGWVYRVNRSTRETTASVYTGTNSLCRRMVWDGWSNIWVACFTSNYVAQIDTASASLVRFVAVGPAPWGIMYDPAQSNIYVANYATDTVQRIAITSGVVTATWGSGNTQGQHDLVISKGRLFVVNSNSNTIRQRSLTYGPGNAVGYTMQTGTDPDGLLVDGDYIYCTSALQPSLEKWRVPRQ